MTTTYRLDPVVEAPSDGVARITRATINGYADAVAFLLLDGLLTHRVTGNMVVAAIDLARRAGKASVPRVAMLLPVLLIAVVAVTAAIGTSDRHGPSRSAVLLLGLQAVVAGTFLVLAAVRYPNASTGALVALAIMGAGGVAAVACQSALFRMVRDRAGWTTLVELM